MLCTSVYWFIPWGDVLGARPSHTATVQGSPVFPPRAFHPPPLSSPAEEQPLPEAGAAEAGEVLGPKGQSGLRLPLLPPPQFPPPPRKSNRLGAAERQRPAGDAGHRGQRADRVPVGRASDGGGGRQGAAEATAGSLPPALGRGPAGAQARRRRRRRRTNPAAWERSPQRLTNRKRLTSGAEGGARRRLRSRRNRGLRQLKRPRRGGRLSGRAQAHSPCSPPQPFVSASSAACWSRVRRQPKRTGLRAPVAKRSAWRGSSVPSAAAAGAAAAAQNTMTAQEC